MSIATARPRLPDLPRHAGLWTLALLAFGIGDTVTTSVGLSMGATELNPVVADVATTHGAAGIAGLKATVLAGGVAAYAAVPAPANVGIPIGLALVGVLVTGWNALLLSGVVGV